MDHPPRGQIGVCGKEEEGGSRTRVALLNADVTKEEWQTAADGRSWLCSGVWAESRKLWEIVGPAIFSRIATYSMNVITQAFAGHLGDLELAAISIANTVVVGFNYGLMVRVHIITPRSATLPAFIQLLDRYTCYSLSTLG